MQVEIAQIILLIDGQPKLVRIPEGREHLVLGLLQSVFDNGSIAVSSLPPQFQWVSLDEKKPL